MGNWYIDESSLEGERIWMGKSMLFFGLFIVILLVDPFIPLSSFLRVENSYYESLQYLILFYGFFLGLKDIGSTEVHLKSLGWSGAPLWVVVFGREINWGRIFVPYDRIYRMFTVYPLVAISVGASIYIMFKHNILTNVLILIKKKLLPIGECISLILLAFGSYLGEKIIGSEFIEISMELVCYANLLWLTIQVRVLFQKNLAILY